MPTWIAGSAARTCHGDAGATFAALLAGVSGSGPLRHHDPAQVGVGHGYEIQDRDAIHPAGRWLAGCVAEALAQAGIDPARRRVVAVVGTGLRELAAVERTAVTGERWPAERLHFGPSVSVAAPGIQDVLTLANACSAGGHALALGQDLIELGDADAVVVAGTDAMTTSMLAMIGRVADGRADRVRPFDADRTGVLLGDGAAAVVLVPDVHSGLTGVGRLLGTGLSCDAAHETAPDPAGIMRAMRDAFTRSDRRPDDVDAVFAHGTGTALNDPTEARVLAELYAGCRPGPWITAVKGSVGHTSGGSALLSTVLALESLRTGLVPPICGLREPLPEATGLRLVRFDRVPAAPKLVQINSFGFGGVNAVSLVEAA